MKKTLLGSVIVLALALVFSSLALAGVAKITYLERTVEVKFAGTDEWIPAEFGMELKDGDVVRTGDFAKASVELSDRKVLNLNPNSIVKIGEEKKSGWASKTWNRIRNLAKKSSSEESKVTVAASAAIRASKVGEEEGDLGLSEYPTEEELKKSIMVMKKMIRENPQSEMAPELQYLIGETYVHLGNLDRAKREFAKVVENYPDTDWAKLASEKIQ
jgi:tetratricopeptide (TPR) repeat protein